MPTSSKLTITPSHAPTLLLNYLITPPWIPILPYRPQLLLPKRKKYNYNPALTKNYQSCLPITHRRITCKAADVSVAEKSSSSGDGEDNWVAVVPLSALPRGERRVINQEGETILLLWYKDEIFAVENKSPAEGSYTEGFLNAKLTKDGYIVCPKTNSTFDIRTGAIKEWYPKNLVLNDVTPALRTLCVYPVKIDEEDIYINIRGTIKEEPYAESVLCENAQPCVTATDVNVGKVTAKWDSDYLVDSEQGWRVRRLVKEDVDMRKAAKVQAEAFHEPVAIFNRFFFLFFEAEVLSGLLYKMRNSPSNRYACLVAVGPQSSSYRDEVIVGVADVTVLRDQAVLKHLPLEAQEYLYVSGIAVSQNFRRRKVATALLEACDVLSEIWGFQFLALRAYEDDMGARNLYTKAGYRVIDGDPDWFTTWLGRKRRLLLIKSVLEIPPPA